MHISTKNSEIKASLERIESAVLKHGGYAHPEMTIHESKNNIWISCTEAAESETLLSIPIALFIPVTQLNWQFSNGALHYFDHSSSLTEVQRQLLDDMVHIYNLTDKVSTHQTNALSWYLANNADYLRWFREAWTDYVLPKPDPAMDFLATRWVRLTRDAKLQSNIKYLMPFIDLMNHHPNGPKIQHQGLNRQLTTFVTDKKIGECSWCYNGSDSLSLTYQHGYLDTNTSYVASLDCRLQHSLIGDIHIIGNDDNHKAVNAPTLLANAEALTIQSIVLQKSKLSPLKTLIGLAIRSKQPKLAQLDAERIAGDLIHMIIDANMAKYTQLQQLCGSETMANPSIEMLIGVARHQLLLLNGIKSAL